MDQFLTVLYNANEIVHQYYPAAQFLDFSHDPTLLGSPWIFTFDDRDKNVILKYFEGTGFATPPEVAGKKLGLRTIPLFIGATEAQKKVPQPAVLIGLNWVLYYNIDEPNYLFNTPEGVAFVGAYSGKLQIMKAAVPATPQQVQTPVTTPPAITR